MLGIVPLMIETVKKYKISLGNFDDNDPIEGVGKVSDVTY
jgi:hypothetical protein